MKGDPMDLRLDIERRKKYSTHEREYNQDRGRDMKGSPDFNRERSEENVSKFCKRLKYVQLPKRLKLSVIILNSSIVIVCNIKIWA